MQRRSILQMGAMIALAAASPGCAVTRKSQQSGGPAPNTHALLIHGGDVVTMDSSKTIISNGALLIRGNSIEELGESDALRARHPSVPRLDASGKLILPGFINTHLHPALLSRRWRARPQGAAPFDGSNAVVEDRPPNVLSKAGRVPGGAGVGSFMEIIAMQRAAPAADIRILARYALMIAIRNGVTCFVEGGSLSGDGVAQAALDMGVRAGVSIMSMDMMAKSSSEGLTRFSEVDRELAQAQAFVERWHGQGDGRLTAWYSPMTDVMCSDELLRGIAELARRTGHRIFSHSATCQPHEDFSLAYFGSRSVSRLAKLGVLGPDWLGAHMGSIGDEEIALVRQAGGHVAHCVGTSSLTGGGLVTDRQIIKMMQAGVNVGLGSDSLSEGTYVDQITSVFRQHKEAWGDDRILPPYKVLEMATINGAKAAGIQDQVGSLERGKRADIILIDTSRPDYAGLDPVTTLPLYLEQEDVRTVIVDGRILMKDRTLVVGDADRIVADMLRVAATMPG